MNIGRTVLKVGGGLLALYGILAVVLSFMHPEVKVTLDWYKTVVECIAGGGFLIFVSGYVDKVTSFVKSKIPAKKADSTPAPTKTVVTTTKEEKVMPATDNVWEFLITNYDHLNDLANKLSEFKDTASVDLCRQLQKKLLDLHYDKTTKPATPSV